MPRHPTAVAAESVYVPTYSSVPSPRTGTDEYVGFVVCVVSDNKMGYAFPATSGLLAGGHILAVSVCLTQLALEIRESRAAETIYPFK